MISKTKNIGIMQGRETIITLFIAISFLVLMNGKIGAKEISDEGMKDYLSRYGHRFENLDRSSYIPSKKVYMEEKVESYKNDMIKQYGKVITEDDLKSKYINQLLDDYEKKEYNKDDAIENLRKLLDLSSICFFASDLNCVVPLRRLKNQFELSTLTYEIYFIGGISRRKGKSTEYPLIHLALQCGEKAVEPLRELILDDELSSKNRVWALGTLFKIDEKEAKIVSSMIYDDMIPVWQGRIRTIQSNKNIEPWDIPSYVEIPPRFKQRLEAGKLRMKPQK